jgi:hypothetical protein
LSIALGQIVIFVNDLTYGLPNWIKPANGFAEPAKAIKAQFPSLKVGGPGMMNGDGSWAAAFLSYCHDFFKMFRN